MTHSDLHSYLTKKLVRDLLEVRFLLEPAIAAMSATYADDNDIEKIVSLCDEVEELLKQKKDHTQKDIEFHTAIAMGSKNLIIPRLIPIINSSIPLFVDASFTRFSLDPVVLLIDPKVKNLNNGPRALVMAVLIGERTSSACFIVGAVVI